MDLKHIPLSQLKVSPLNMRHARKAPDISDILPSIRAKGVQQPLLVRKNGKGYEIIAGRRRYFCLKTLAEEGAKEGKDIEPVPCAVMADGDNAAALEASLIENVARLAPDEMTRFETFARLASEGRGAKEIATTFGVTEIMVKRSLALGNLLPEIREAFRNEDIDPDTIRHLTLASETQQSEWLHLFQNPNERAPRGRQLKHWLFGGEIKLKTALFPLETYQGEIVTDLFGEGGLFADTDQFWKLQNAAIAERREALLKAGWDDVIVLDPGTYFASWDHVETPKKDAGRIYVEVRSNGEVMFHKGFITRKEHDKRLRQRAGESSSDNKPSARSELTQVAQNYVELHRHAAVRAALIGHQQLALRVMAAHAISGSSLWQTRAEPQKADKAGTAKSLQEAKTQAVFERERTEVLKLLGLPEDRIPVTRSTGLDTEIGAVLVTLIKLSDADVLRVLTFVMAETLAAGTNLIEQIGIHLKIDMADHWEAEDSFFDLLRDKAALNEILAEVAGRETANAHVSATAKVQKQVIRERLASKEREKNGKWLPRYLKFPFAAYTKAGAGRISENAALAQRNSG